LVKPLPSFLIYYFISLARESQGVNNMTEKKPGVSHIHLAMKGRARFF